MDWKKEKISGAELEKRSKEYLNAAVSMMKRSSATQTVHAPEPQTVPHIAEPAVPEASAKPAKPAETEPGPTEPSEVVTEKAEPEELQDSGSESESEPEKDETYGVYTAEELLAGDHSDDGLRKAAEILEEMTRSAEIMKRLTADGGDPGITDFPEFSCAGDDSSFRGEEDVPECPQKAYSVSDDE